MFHLFKKLLITQLHFIIRSSEAHKYLKIKLVTDFRFFLADLKSQWISNTFNAVVVAFDFLCKFFDLKIFVINTEPYLLIEH